MGKNVYALKDAKHRTLGYTYQWEIDTTKKFMSAFKKQDQFELYDSLFVKVAEIEDIVKVADKNQIVFVETREISPQQKAIYDHIAKVECLCKCKHCGGRLYSVDVMGREFECSKCSTVHTVVWEEKSGQ